jgi:hypothetical protein
VNVKEKVKKESAWRHANIQTNKPKGNNINQLIYDYVDKASLEKNKIKKNKNEHKERETDTIFAYCSAMSSTPCVQQYAHDGRIVDC